MSKSQEILVKCLEIPRPSITVQGFAINEKNSKPVVYMAQDRGDLLPDGESDPYGKSEMLVLPGGGVENIFDLVFDGQVYMDIMERDLDDVTEKGKGIKLFPMELNGETLSGKFTLNTLFHQYDFGSRLPLKARRIGSGEIVEAVVHLKSMEDPKDAMIREFTAETGFNVTLKLRDEAINPRTGKKFPARFGELSFEQGSSWLEKKKPEWENKVFHYILVYQLQVEGLQLEMDEVDEVKWAGPVTLDEILRKIFLEELSGTNGKNPSGISRAHAMRVMSALWDLEVNYDPYLPKQYSWEMLNARKTFLQFLPEEIQDGIFRGQFDFNGGNGGNGKNGTAVETVPVEPVMISADDVAATADEEDDDDNLSHIAWKDKLGMPSKIKDDSADKWAEFLGDYAKPVKL